MTAGTIVRTDPRPRLALATTALLVTFAAGTLAGVLAAPAIHGVGAPAAPAAGSGAAAYQIYLRGEADSYGSASGSTEQAHLLFLRGEAESYGR